MSIQKFFKEALQWKLGGGAQSAGVATYALDSSSNVTGLVGPSGALASIPFIPNGGQAAIPVILPSSGTITNGVLSALTALPTAYGGAWMYFPAGASLPSGAGLYWVSSVTTTGGNITTTFASTAVAFTPYIPASPVLITSGGAAYTQTIGSDITLANITVPGGLMGANGTLRAWTLTSSLSNANIKNCKVALGGISNLILYIAETNNGNANYFVALRNRGLQNSNVSFAPGNGRIGAESGGASAYYAIDTSTSQALTFTGQIAVATDYIVLEGFTVEVLPRA